MPVHHRLPVPALLLAAGLGLAISFAAPATAQMLCDCCGQKTEQATPEIKAPALPEACREPCRQGEQAAGLCRPVILPDVRDQAQRNPLLGVNLKFLDLNGLSRPQLERVRRWAEKWRAQAERRYRRAKARLLRGRLDAEAFRREEARRDAVVVNYQHVIRAYRAAITPPNVR